MADLDSDDELYDDSHIPNMQPSAGPVDPATATRIFMECKEAYYRLHPEQRPVLPGVGPLFADFDNEVNAKKG